MIVPRTHPHSSLIEQVIRVNHAVKHATESFTAGQRITREKKDQTTRVSLINVDLFERMIYERRVRPTVSLPLLNGASFALGIGSCLAGDKVAKVCKLTLLNFVEDNCNRQLRELLNNDHEVDDLIHAVAVLRDEVAIEAMSLNQKCLIQSHDLTVEMIMKLIRTGCNFTTCILRSM